MYDYDVICIGAGPGGSASAMRCADRGKRVAIVEARTKNGVGGTCVNRGCIPTKALMASTNLFASLKTAKALGIGVGESAADFKAINRRKNAVVNNLSFGLENFLMKPRGIDVIKARGRLLDAHTVELDDGREKRSITAENLVIAVGSEPAYIPAFHIDGKKIVTSNELLDLTSLPKDILVVGAGAIGLEYGYLLNTFGVKVTVVEMMPNVVPVLHEPEITDAVLKSLTRSGITVRTGVGIREISVREDGMVRASLATGEEIVTEMALVGIGRTLNTADIGLEAAGVQTGRRGMIPTDAQLRTNVPNIFAAGDITEGPQLADKAQRQGLVIAETIAGNEFHIRYDAIPSAIFTEPEIAMIGMTASDAEAAGIRVMTGMLPFTANEKATAMQRTEGLIKVVAREDDHRIIGAQIFGAEACDLISEFAVAMENDLKLEALAFTMHPHPTLTEIVMEVCKRALGLAFDRS